MPDCVDTLLQLYRYLDRDLTDQEIAEVRRHLADCPPCGEVVFFEDNLRRLVKAKASGDCAPVRLRRLIVETWRRTRG